MTRMSDEEFARIDTSQISRDRLEAALKAERQELAMWKGITERSQEQQEILIEERNAERQLNLNMVDSVKRCNENNADLAREYSAMLARAEAAEAKLKQYDTACEAMAIRLLGQEKYDNSPCQAHPMELIEQEFQELQEKVK
jgi:hypothetical protein